jgi:hypothetical protein
MRTLAIVLMGFSLAVALAAGSSIFIPGFGFILSLLMIPLAHRLSWTEIFWIEFLQQVTFNMANPQLWLYYISWISSATTVYFALLSPLIYLLMMCLSGMFMAIIIKGLSIILRVNWLRRIGL